MSSEKTQVLVTGAGGFIASNLIKVLIDRGTYKVRGTVRDPSNEEKVGHLRKLFPELELVKADLVQDGSFDEAVKGCTYVFHTASPFQLKVDDPQKDLIEPALNGTLNVLKAAAKEPSIKRVVVTSSVAAISSDKPADYVFTEADWNLESTLTNGPYRLSKRLAEEAAWDFAKGKHFDIVTINPSLVVGPPLSDRVDSTSVNVIKSLIDGSLSDKGTPPMALGCVDVKDVAEAHVRAVENKEAKGRYMMTTDRAYTTLELAQILKKSGKFEAYGIPTKAQSQVEKIPKFDTSKVTKELGITLTPVDKFTVDMAQALIDLGIVGKK